MNPEKLVIRSVKFRDGERYPVLVDASGMPHAQAMLFLTTQVRNASKAPNTMRKVLLSIRAVLRWANISGIDFEARFAARQFLNGHEIESLRRGHWEPVGGHVGRRKASNVSPLKKERSRATAGGVAHASSPPVAFTRMSYAAEYLEWFAKYVVEREARHIDRATMADIKAMAIDIRRRWVRKKSRSRLTAKRGLDEHAQQRVIEIAHPTSSENPYEGPVRQRNFLIFRVLHSTGLRASELLALKVSDFDFQENTVVVARRHDDPDDPRADQPVLKTMDRRLPLNAELATLISNYVMNERRACPRARRHLFLLVTHQVGPHQGKPLSYKGLWKLVNKMSHHDSNLTGLTAHVFRHTANEELSIVMDEGNVTPADEEKMRSYQMGWKEGSGTAATYTLRHTERKAKGAALKLQQRIMLKGMPDHDS